MDGNVREDLGLERRRRVKRASVAGLAFQSTYALVQFVMLAVLLRYLGTERFGMWMTALAIGSWLLLANLGLNNALVTRLGAVALTRRDEAQAVMVNAVLTVTAVSVGLAILFVIGGWAVPWAAVLNVQDDGAVRDAAPVMIIALVLSAAALPATLGGMSLLAHQRGDIAHIVMIVAQLAGLAGVLIGVRLGWSLPALGAVVLSVPLVGGLAQWWLGLRKVLPPLSAAAVDRRMTVSLLGTGAKFLLLEGLAIVLLHSGAVIIAQLHGAAQVTSYAAVYRLAGLMLAVFQVILFPFWPAYGEALSRGDVAWITRALWRSGMLVLGVWAVVTVGFGLFGQMFIRLWMGEQAVPDPLLLWAMLTLGGVQGLTMWLAVPLNGIGRLGSQILSGTVMSALYVPLAVWLCGLLGAAGVVIVQAALMLLIGLPLNGIYLWRHLRAAGRLTVRPEQTVSPAAMTEAAREF